MKKLFILLVASAIGCKSVAQLSVTEQALVDQVEKMNASGLEFLKDIVDINSGTMNFAGVAEVGKRLAEAFEKLGMEVRWESGEAFNRAGHLIAQTPENEKGKKVLLIGHLDTVFDKNSTFQHWNVLSENEVQGPGIADMKGGDVIILQALKALKAEGLLDQMNLRVVMTGDEEDSGQPLESSKKALIDGAKWADVALGFENADGDPMTGVVARRSSSSWTLEVTANAAHSSQIFQPDIGAGAILEASRILIGWYQALSDEEYLTFNPGRIIGGTKITTGKNSDGTAFGKNNVVAQSALINGDLRCLTPAQIDRVINKMQAVVDASLPGTSAQLTVQKKYPPFAPKAANEELLERYSQVSQDLGFGAMTAVNPRNAGAADISFTAYYIDAGIDGMGLGGRNDHTVNEVGYLHSFPMQTKKAVVLLYRLTR